MLIDRSVGEPRRGQATDTQLGATRLRPGLGESLLAYGYLAPAMALLLLFSVAPFLYVFYASLQHAPAAPNQRFVGLENFHYLLDPAQQSGFLDALSHTLEYALGVVPGGLLLSLACALLLRRKVKGWALYRLLFFLPFVTPVLPTSIIWIWIFNQQYGLLNAVLSALHLPTNGWTNDPAWAMPSVIIYSLWQSAGFTTVLLLAGLTTIPHELEEAAAVDGAGRWAVTRLVTLPLLTPTIFFVLVVSTIESLKVFSQIYALTGGGPGGATTTVGFYLYQDIQYFHFDYASAVAVVMFGLVLVLTLVQQGLARFWVHYG